MCIICIKKMGVLYPTKSTVKTMCDNNPDGFSIVLSHRGKRPMIYKTLNKKDFLNVFDDWSKKYDYNETSMFIHARIKTHGSARLENCHGWRSDGLVFAHNGILSIENRGDLTDSETFFRDIFIPAYRCGGWKMAERTVDAIIGTSKFVFIDKNGDIKHYGNYVEDNGLLYSNTTYIEWRQRYTSKVPYCSRYYAKGYPKTQSTAQDWNQAYYDQYLGNDDCPF